MILNSFEVLPKSPLGERISTAQRSANTSPSACPRTIYVFTFSSIIYFQRDTGDTIVHLSLHDFIFEKIVLCLTKNWRGWHPVMRPHGRTETLPVRALRWTTKTRLKMASIQYRGEHYFHAITCQVWHATICRTSGGTSIGPFLPLEPREVSVLRACRATNYLKFSSFC